MNDVSEINTPENSGPLAANVEPSEANKASATVADNLFKNAAVQDEKAEHEKRVNKMIDLMIGVKNHERLMAAGFNVEYTGFGMLQGASGRTADRRSDGSAGKGDSE